MHTVKDVTTLPGAAFYRWFASYPVLLEESENMIRFGDLAFGAGAPGVRSAFELRIEGYNANLKYSGEENHLAIPSQARAYLIWRNNHKSELTQTKVPFDWLK